MRQEKLGKTDRTNGICTARITALAIAALCCLHLGAVTEGALKVAYSSSAVKWIAPSAGTMIPSTTSGGDVQPFTIECWVKMNRLSGRQQILNQYKNGDPGRVLLQTNGKTPTFILGTKTQTAKTELEVGVWTHIAAVRNDSGKMFVYINGADDSSSSQSNTNALYVTDLLICNLASSTSFDGEVSELRVWSTARSSAEISANYARRMTGNEDGLLYCWPMDDGPGSASCRELVSGAAAAIAVDKVTNNQVVFLDTMLPHVLFRQTIAADTSDALSIRPGTLAVPANADVTLSGGYTMDPGKNTAGVIEVGEGASLTVDGAATSVSGGFVKTGAGTLCYTGTADHVISFQNRAMTKVLSFDPCGAGPTNGWQSATVAEGTVKVDQPDGGSVSVGASGDGNLVVGAAWSADGSDERAAHFVLENGTVNANVAYIGYWRGTAANAPSDCPTSTLTVNGGSLLLSEGLRVGYANAVFTLNGGLVEVVPVPADSSALITDRDLRIGMARPGIANVVVNLNGGILRVQNMSRFQASNRETVINFNGGTWQLNGKKDLALSNVASNIVCAGGAKLDASLLDGVTFAVAGNFLHDSSLGETQDGGVTLLGGALTWRSAASTFTGPLTVKSGATLALDTAGATVPASFVLESGATLSVFVAADGTATPLALGGAATLGGAVELVDESSGGLLTANGVYEILTYSGAAPDVSDLSAPYLPSGKTVTFAAAGGAVTMTIASMAEAVRWNVDADGFVDDPANWLGTFSDGSAVTFGDVITADRTVTVTNGNLSLDSITFDSAAASWTLAGTGLTVIGNITASNGSHVVTAPLDIPHGTTVAAEDGASLSLGTVSGEGSIATAGRVSLGDTSGLSGLSVASGRLTLSAIRSDITVGQGVLHYVGPDATTTNSISLDPGTFSDNGVTKGHAAIIQTDHDLTVTGSFNCQSGAFLKRGPGKLTLTVAEGALSYLGRRYNTQGSNQVADNDTPALAVGDAPATGYGAAAVIDGTLELVGGGTFTDVESLHVGIGSVGIGEGLKETAGTLVLDGPTLTVGGQCNIGFLNGFAATADEPVHSVLRVKSGTLNLNNSTSACLNMGMGETEGMFIAPELVIDGGTVNMNNNTIAFGRATAAPTAGSRVTITMNGGRLNHKVSDNFKFGAANPGANQMPTIFNMNGGTLTVSDGEILLGCYNSNSTLNFNGGTIVAKSIRRSATQYGTSNTLFWNGGTFQPNADGYKSSNIFNALVSTNGCKVNVGSGISHIIASTLKHDPGLGDMKDGGVTKTGAGLLALTNVNNTAVCTFTGPVNVNGGTLVLTPIMTNDVTVANNTVLSVPLAAKIGGLSGRGTVTGNAVEILGTIAVPLTGKLTVSSATLRIGEAVAVDFGRDAGNAVGTADKIAVLDVSGVGSLVVPESVRGVNSGRDDQPRVSLTVEDGTLYATIAPSGTTLIFR